MTATLVKLQLLKSLNEEHKTSHIVNFRRKKKNEPPHDRTKKMTVRPAKTRISLGICPVWSESSLCTQWVDKEQSFLRADSGCPDWSESALGVQTTLLVLSWGRFRGRFSRQLVVVTKQSMLTRLHSLEANATCGTADADYTEWRNFYPYRRFWHFWKIKHFLAKIIIFPIMEQWKKNRI